MAFLDILRRQLLADEGRIPHAYQDSEGYWTIGVGRLIDKRRGGGLSESEIDFLLANDISEAEVDARALVPGFDGLTDARKAVLCNLAFNLGRERLARFRNALRAVNEGRYEDAARELLDSKWSTQVGERAQRLARQMQDG